MIYSTILSADLQTLILSTTDWMILLMVSCVILFGAFITYRIYNEDIDKSKKAIMIKVDRNGKYRYQVKENLDKGKFFWIKLLFAIITLGLLCIPIHSWFYKS